MADAAAHARNALTATLRDTAEGRATAARVRRSRSYAAALDRLDSLRDAIVAVVGRTRAEEYRKAWAFWREHLPEDATRPGDGPTAARVDRCRSAILHGMTILQEIDGRIGPYRRRLLPLLTVAGSRATAKKDADSLVAGWVNAAVGGISAGADAMLNDSIVFADRMAGRDVIRPELLDPDPSLPE